MTQLRVGRSYLNDHGPAACTCHSPPHETSKHIPSARSYWVRLHSLVQASTHFLSTDSLIFFCLEFIQTIETIIIKTYNCSEQCNSFWSRLDDLTSDPPPTPLPTPYFLLSSLTSPSIIFICLYFTVSYRYLNFHILSQPYIRKVKDFENVPVTLHPKP